MHPTECGTRTAEEGHVLQTTKRSDAWHTLTNIQLCSGLLCLYTNKVEQKPVLYQWYLYEQWHHCS